MLDNASETVQRPKAKNFTCLFSKNMVSKLTDQAAYHLLFFTYWLPSHSRCSRQLQNTSIVPSPLSHQALSFRYRGIYKIIFSYRTDFNLLDLWGNNYANRTQSLQNHKLFKGGSLKIQCMKADIASIPISPGPKSFPIPPRPPTPPPPQFWLNQRKNRIGICNYEGMAVTEEITPVWEFKTTHAISLCPARILIWPLKVLCLISTWPRASFPFWPSFQSKRGGFRAK